MNGKHTPGRSRDEWLELVTIPLYPDGKAVLPMLPGVMKMGFLPAVFTMLSAGFAKEPVRYQNHLEKQALSILHPINRM